jgi:hypothetical protein
MRRAPPAGRLLKNTPTCHFEGGFSQRNLLFPYDFREKQIPRFACLQQACSE